MVRRHGRQYRERVSTFAVISVVIWLLFGANNIWLARKDGRSPIVWFFLTAPFGLLATGFLVLAKAPAPSPARWDSRGSFRREFVAPRSALALSAVALITANALDGTAEIVLLASAVALFVAFVALTVVGVQVARQGLLAR